MKKIFTLLTILIIALSCKSEDPTEIANSDIEFGKAYKANIQNDIISIVCYHDHTVIGHLHVKTNITGNVITGSNTRLVHQNLESVKVLQVEQTLDTRLIGKRFFYQKE